jgi:hypothetical protein
MFLTEFHVGFALSESIQFSFLLLLLMIGMSVCQVDVIDRRRADDLGNEMD